MAVTRKLKRKKIRLKQKVRKTRLRRKNGKMKRKSLYDQGYDRGFDAGLNQGVNQAHEKGYAAGYRDGYRTGSYEGGEAIVDRLLEPYETLLDVPLSSIVEVGVRAYAPSRIPLLRSEMVYGLIMESLREGKPFSLIRLGDGELLTMAQERVMSIDQVQQEGGHFLPYAGVQLPDLAGRDALLAAVRSASVVGIPQTRMANYQPLARAVFHAYDIPYRSMQLTDSQINFLLHHDGWLQPILRAGRLLVVGNKSPELAQYLQARGYHVSGVVHPVHGLRDVERVMGEVSRYEFDIALISAGVAAVLIAERTARQFGKVAIDFGHLSDALMKGEMHSL